MQKRAIHIWYYGIIYTCLFLFSSAEVQAFVREFPEYESYGLSTIVEDLTTQQLFYGELDSFPHNYEFIIAEDTELFAEVLVPAIADIETNRNGIIVKKVPRRGVEEIARMSAETAEWSEWYESQAGDTYLRGGSFSGTLGPGEYVLEVSTPVNQGKYVLRIGTEPTSFLSPFGQLGDVYRTKRFFDKLPVAVLQSPYYMTVVLLVICGLLYLWYRRKHSPPAL